MARGTYGSMRGTYGSSLGSMTEQTRAANKAREDEIRKILDQVMAMYQPGGQFGKGTEAMLTQQKKKDIAAATQSLVSSGLYGTTLAAGLPSKWEADVGMPARAKLEDIRYGALTEAMRQKAGFVERIEDMYPDYGMLAQLQSQASSAPSGGFGNAPMMSLPAYGAFTGGTRSSSTPAWVTEQNRKAEAEIKKRKAAYTKTFSGIPGGEVIYGGR